MSKAGSFLGGLGIGAAAGYAKKRNQEASDARIAARAAGQPLPAAEPSFLEAGIGKVNEFLAPAAATATPADLVAPVTDNRPTFNVSLAEQAALAPPRALTTDTQSVETEAFNDDATVPNEPTPFKNSYAG